MLKMNRIFCGFLFIFLGLLRFSNAVIEDPAYWDSIVKAEMEEAKNVKWNTGKAKNIILFIGDGMGPDTVTSTRIYQKGEEGRQVFEEFPHVGIVKTYSTDLIVPDSAATATAIFSGVKVNSRTGGVDTHVRFKDCKSAANKAYQLPTILDWAQEAKKSTGFITTTRVTHATPMALYAKIANRDWECEANMPEECQAIGKDIARQLIEDAPGKNLNVIMGGGLQALKEDIPLPLDAYTCHRNDSRDLPQDWIDDKNSQNLANAYVQTMSDLMKVDTKKTDYLLGIFSKELMLYEDQRIAQGADTPSIVNMTTVALKILRKNPNGFFIMIEGGMIDMAHHRGHARRALNEAAAMNDAIQAALDLMEDELDETLFIVTADHGHSVKLVGYPERHTGVLGFTTGKAKLDGMPYTSLLYAVGGANNYQFEVVDGKAVRSDPSQNDTTDFEYSQEALVGNDEVVHGGADVYVYAKGPQAHLFHSLHEQPFIARVMACAAEIGPCKGSSNAAKSTFSYFTVLLLASFGTTLSKLVL